MSVELGEFYYLIGVAVAYLAILVVYNWVGGKKKAKKN